MILTVILFLFILGILVFVHELGHFVAAKKLGVKVEEFAFGFKPKIWSVKKGETTYAINAIPLGGYCTLYGQDENLLEGNKKSKEPKDFDRSFMSKSPLSKIIILVAGVAMNFLLAWIIFTIILITGFEPLVSGMVEGRGVKILEPVKITSVEKNSPAQKVGLKKNDLILAVDNKAIGSSLEVVSKIYEKNGKEATLEIKRGDQILNLGITPRKNPPKDSGPIGIGLAGGKIGAVWYKAPFVAMGQVGKLTGMTVGAVGNFVNKLFVKREISKEVSGMVGVGFATDVVRKLGLTYVLQFIALISVSLGVMNLLPIVPLDGGHVFVTVIEKIRKKRLSENQMQWFGMGGLAFILLLVVVTTYSDIMRFSVWDRLVNLFK